MPISVGPARGPLEAAPGTTLACAPHNVPHASCTSSPYAGRGRPPPCRCRPSAMIRRLHGRAAHRPRWPCANWHIQVMPMALATSSATAKTGRVMFGRSPSVRSARSLCSEPEGLPCLKPSYSAALSVACDPAETKDLVVEAFTRACAFCRPRQSDANPWLRLYRSLASARWQQREAWHRASGRSADLDPARSELSALAGLNPARVADALLRLPCGPRWGLGTRHDSAPDTEAPPIFLGGLS